MKKGIIPIRLLSILLFSILSLPSIAAEDEKSASFEPSDSPDVTANCLPAFTLVLDDMGSATLDPADIDDGSSSSSPIVSTVLDFTSFSCSDIGTVSVTLTVEDSDGDSDSCTSLVAIVDQSPPVVNCIDNSGSLNANGKLTVSVSDFNSGLSDNCSPTVSASILNPFDGWLEEIISSSNNINATYFTSSSTGWIVGNLGAVYQTTDGGDNWIAQPALGASDLFDLFFVGNLHGWAVGAGSTIYHTSDGGLNWTLQTSPILGFNLFSVHFTDTLNGWIVGSGNTVLQTTDGGTTWNAVSVLGASLKRAVFFSDLNNGWIVGNNGDIVNTIDGGMTWNAQVSGTFDVLRDVAFSDSMNGWAVGNNGTILRTVDGGASWSSQVSGSTATLRGIDLYSSTSAYIVGNTGTLLQTEDEGLSWTTVDLGVVATLRSVFALSAQDATVIGGVDKVFSYFNGVLEQGILEFDCDDIGIQSIDLQFSDGFGNSSNCTVNLDVLDSTAPLANCFATATVNLDSDGLYVFSGLELNDSSSDNCDDLVFSVDPVSVDCSSLGVQTITLTVSDSAMNTDQCTTDVTVVDNELPVANCQDVIANLDSSGAITLLASDFDNGSTDNCSSLSFTTDLSTLNFSCSDIGNISLVLTVEDQSGNTDACNAQLTISDTEAPSIICLSSVSLDLDADGLLSISSLDVLSSISDNCTLNPLLSISPDNFDCSNAGTIVSVQVSAADDAGNSSQCAVDLTVNDAELPVLDCIDLTVDLNSDGEYNLDPNVMVNSVSDNCVINTFTASNTFFDCTNLGTNQVVLTATDQSNNVASCMVELTINDPESPQLTCSDITVNLDASGTASISETDIIASLTDNCGSFTFNLNTTSFGCDDLGINSVDLTVFDGSNNSANCTVIVTIDDITPPVIQCQDLNLFLDASGSASLVATDYLTSFSDNCTVDNISATQLIFDCTSFSELVTVSVTDQSGNSSDCVSTVSLSDNIVPFIDCEDVIVAIDADGEYNMDVNLPILSAIDNCGIASLVASNTFFDCDNLGSNSVTITASDASGNSNDCDIVLTLIDDTPPVLDCTSAQIVLDDQGIANLELSDVLLSVSDNCELGQVLLSESSFDCDALGNNTITITANDVNGNQDFCSVQLEVLDLTAPVLECADFTVSLDPVTGMVNISAETMLQSFSDNCGMLTFVASQTDFSCNDGLQNVLVTVTDVSGNSSDCTSQITIVDNDGPALVCQDITVEIGASGFYVLSPAELISSVSDNCQAFTTSVVNPFLDCSDIGINTIELIATDAAGNETNCFSTVTVVDIIAPQAVCNDFSAALNTNGEVVIAAESIGQSSVDNCDDLPISLSLSISSFNCDDLGDNTIVLTVFDASGNSSSCSSLVTIFDAISPTALCQDITIDLDINGQASINASNVDGGSFDNCGISQMQISDSAFDCSDLGDNFVNLSLEDSSGNADNCVALVTVEDNIAPVLTCIDVTLDLGLSGAVSITESDVINLQSDNCGIASIDFSQSNFDCDAAGTITEVIITATDFGGNITDCSSFVSIEDNLEPALICKDIIVSLDSNGLASVTASDIEVSLFDNCGIQEFIIDVTNFDCTSIGPNQVIGTATDVNGNSSFCFQEITIVDDLAPVVECNDISLSLNFGGQATIDLLDVFVSSTDNCGVQGTVLSQTAFDCSHVGQSQIEVQSTDINGNIGICLVNVVVLDEIAPAVLCNSSVTAVLDANCEFVIPDYTIDLGLADNCTLPGDFQLVQTPQQGTVVSGTGENDILFEVFDVNGNLSTCTTTLTLQDNSSPVLVCNDIDVALNNNGELLIPYSEITQGSFDACSQTLSYSSNIDGQLDCSFVGPFVLEVMVSDESMNSSSCTANITIIDNIPPLVSCNDTSIILDENGFGSLDENTVMAIVGNATDACGIDEMFISITEVSCEDLGFNDIDLSVTDVNGNTTICTSTLEVIDITPPALFCRQFDVALDVNGEGILLPEDVIFSVSDACGIANATVSESFFTCDDIGPHIIELVVTDVAGNETSCLVDVDVEDQAAPVIQCQNALVSLNADGVYFLELDQVLVSATDECADFSINYGPNIFTCSTVGLIPVNVTVTDDYGNVASCTPFVEVLDDQAPIAICTDITIQLDNDGEVIVLAEEYAGNSIDNCDLSFITPAALSLNCSNIGVSTFQITVGDPGGSFDFCSVDITVEDLLGPELILLDTLSLTLEADGNALLNVSELDLGSTDNCANVDLSFTEFNLNTSITFNCDNEGFNTVTVWGTDTFGNQTSAEVVIEVIKSGACEPAINEVILAGEIYKPTGVATPNVDVNLSTGLTQVSDASGAYSFAVLADSSYTISPSRNDNIVNGVTTLDMVKIQLHILQLDVFESPFEYIAADANNSQSVTTLDIVTIRKAILVLEDSFPGINSWRFVDAAYVFPDPMNPWANGGFPETVSIDNLSTDSLAIDFIAVKIGDIDMNATPFTGDIVDNRSVFTHTVHVDDKPFVAAQSIDLSFDVGDLSFIGGQFALSYDPDKLELLALNSDLLNIDEWIHDEERAQLMFSFTDLDGYKEESLFELQFFSKSSGNLSNSISINEEFISAEVYSPSLDIIDLDLVFDDRASEVLKLIGSSPNPFNSEVNIDFDLPEDTDVKLMIRDQQGRIIWEESGHFQEGRNSFRLRGIRTTGLLIYELITEKDRLVGKMIRQ